MYDFHKTRAKDKDKEFKHEYLRKGKPEYLKYIKRKIGEETVSQGNKSEGLLQKCKELEERCRTYESLARLSVPIKQLKQINNVDSTILFKGLMTFMEEKPTCDAKEKSIIDQLTQEYIEKLHQVKLRKLHSREGSQAPTAGSPKESSDDQSNSLGKRKLETEHKCNVQLTLAEEQLDAQSLHSEDFGLDLLDFKNADDNVSRCASYDNNSQYAAYF